MIEQQLIDACKSVFQEGTVEAMRKSGIPWPTIVISAIHEAWMHGHSRETVHGKILFEAQTLINELRLQFEE